MTYRALWAILMQHVGKRYPSRHRNSQKYPLPPPLGGVFSVIFGHFHDFRPHMSEGLHRPGPKNHVFRSQKSRSDAAIDLYGPQMSLPAMWSRRNHRGPTRGRSVPKNLHFLVSNGICTPSTPHPDGPSWSPPPPEEPPDLKMLVLGDVKRFFFKFGAYAPMMINFRKLYV